MREVFAKELADRSAPARRSFAQRLLSEAEKSEGAPTDQYVLLCGAIEAAKEGGSAALALKAADDLARAFEVDGRAIKLAAVSVTAAKADDPAEARAAANSGLELAGAALDADDYDAARQAVAAAEAAARKARDPAVSEAVAERAREVRALQEEWGRVQKDLAALASNPADPSANLSAGRFFCFSKGDWARGLPMLARGKDAALQSAAAAELAAGSSGAADPGRARLKAADGWWAVAARLPAPAKGRVEAHALALYRAALPGLGGLEKVRAQKLLAEAFPFAVTPGERYAWERGKEPVAMIPAAGGFCVLAELGGGFIGGGEEVRIGVGEDGVWHLAGKAAADPFATALALNAPAPGALAPPRSYEWKPGMPPVRMIRTDEGVCVFAGLAGGMRGPGESIRVYPDDDGFWYLACKSGTAFTAYALAVRPAKPRPFRAEYKEYEWKRGSAPVRMIGKEEGFCFLSGVAGQLQGAAEHARVYIGDDAWYLDATTLQDSFVARAISVRVLPAK